jgi:2-polyprenyl-3-methyl-5-hydroxy-6-metoxy-1,4-benzoquinol methylase
MMDSLLQYRNCPSCGRNDFTVLFDSNMNKGDLQQAIETVYMLPGGKYGRHVKCRYCELVYVNPIEEASKINDDYSMRKSVDVSIIRGGRLRATKSQAQLVKKYNNSTSLLDVGCGEGFFLFNASKAGYITKGVELSQEAAAYAMREFGLDVEAKPFEQLRFPENYFDVVTMWQVLEHLPHPLTVLKEANRILKPGGLLAVSTPDIEGIPARLLGKRWWNIRKIHINQFTTKTLKAILENAGFKNVSSACYRESISLLMLLMPLLRSPKPHKPLRGLLSPGSVLGRAMDKIMLAYPSRLDNTTMIGFK